MERKKVSAVQEELVTPAVIRIFSAYLIAIPIATFALIVMIYGAVKGWENWPQAYLYPFTWLVSGISVQASQFLAITSLSKKSVSVSKQEEASLILISRAVSIIFFCLALGTLTSYLS